MRVLFANEKLGWFGGVEQCVADSASGLRRRGHDCILAHGPEARDADAYRSSFDRTLGARELGAEGTEARDFADIVRETRPDVIYLHKVPASLIRTDHGAAVVRMIHDHDVYCPRRHKYYAWNRQPCHARAGWRCWLDGAFLARDSETRGLRFENIREKLSAMRAHWDLERLLVGSRFMESQLRENGCPEERIRIVPPVVELDGERTPRSGSSDSGARFLYVGQLIRGKGVDALLQAMAAIRDAGIDATLTLAGDGSDRSRLESIAASRRLEPTVTFEGFVPHADLGARYAGADAVVVPSRWPEPFGLVGLEAMRHARPVVAFDSGGIGDWLESEETGILVPSGDIAGLAQALTRIAMDRTLARKLGEAGRRRYDSEFATEHLVDRLETALEEAAA